MKEGVVFEAPALFARLFRYGTDLARDPESTTGPLRRIRLGRQRSKRGPEERTAQGQRDLGQRRLLTLAAGGLLAVIAVLASFLLAHWASRLDPVTPLRHGG
jgi:hypothetical protein